MAKNIYKLLLYILFLSIPLLSLRAGEVATLCRYSSKDGLCCNYVHKVIKDRNGFLWLGTEYGLSRFDGVHFKNYYVEENPTLFRNQILQLSLLPDSTLIVAGNNGLLLTYDEKNDSFVDVMPDDFNNTYYKGVTGFVRDKNNVLWITTTNGIYYYNEAIKKFDKYPCVSDSTEKYFMSGMVIDRYGRFFCGNYTGIVVFDKDGKHLKEYDDLLMLGRMVSSINWIDDSHMLVSSFLEGVWIVEIGENGEVYAPKVQDVPFKNVMAVIRDKNDYYWFGTAGSGLWRASYDGKFHCEIIEPKNASSEVLKKIHCLYEDNEGDIWIGTQNAGLLRYSTKRNMGSIHSSDIEFPIVDGTSFAEDDKGNIYVCSDGHGIFVLSPELNILKHLTIDDGLTSNNVLCIRKGPDGEFWIAVWGGDLCKLNPNTFKIEHVPYRGLDMALTTSKVVCPMQNGEVWTATSGGGVYEMNPSGLWKNKILKDTGTFAVPDCWMEDVIVSPTGIRWVVSSRTIWRCDGTTTKAVFPDGDQKLDHRPMVMLNCVCDTQGNLYVASNQGILRVKEDGSTYERLDFLPKGEYQSIVMDKKNTFWTGGSNGILSFKYEDKSYELVSLDEQFMTRNYFTCRASFIDSKGNIYFGSSEGFVIFNPDQLNQSSEVDYLKLSQLYVMGKEQKVGSELLPCPLSDLKELRLNYDETNISFVVDIIDFSGMNSVLLSYRLRELDKDWIHLNEKREINITHIPPGHYQLEVMAKKKGDKGDSQLITLPVIVSPPWWNTWWFYALVVFSVLFITTILIYYRFRRIMSQRELLRVKVAERTKELDEVNHILAQKNTDLEQALFEKDRLLSVIAHDLKNPMFAIVGALDSVLKHHESIESSWHTLKDIYLSAFNLQSAMVKLLEWARGKQQDIACQLQDNSIRKTIQEVLSLLNGLFVDKNIKVEVEYKNLQHRAIMDARMIGTAIRNVLSNSVKFTPENGEIHVEVSENNQSIVIKLSDNGVGMTEEQLEAIRNNENVISTQGTKMEKGTGLGLQLAKEYIMKSGGELLIESQKGYGTTIIINLPISSVLDVVECESIDEPDASFEINTELLQGNTVMIVDDDPLILLHLRTILEPYLNVVEAHDGEEGYQLALQERPDVIISDVEMPNCDGITMYDQIKHDKEISFIPLLFLSAKNAERDRLLGLYKGAIDYISKPFYEKELLIKLTNILQLRREQQQKVLDENMKHQPVAISADLNPMLKTVLDIVAANYSNSSFSADDLCNAMAMSKSTFSRKLKSITDKTPTEILTEYRLHKAKDSLRQGGKTITEIAYAVGFNDPLYFSKKYKLFFGVSPSLEK